MRNLFEKVRSRPWNSVYTIHFDITASKMFNEHFISEYLKQMYYN
jgi:hypothetical protein